LFKGCDIGPWRSAAAIAARRGPSIGSVNVPSGTPFLAVRLDGPPTEGLTLQGPGNRSIPLPTVATNTKQLLVAPVPELQQTYVLVNRPTAGRWMVVAADNAPGSLPRLAASAFGLSQPSVRGTVRRRRGGHYTLSYAVKPLPGQVVAFYDRQPSGGARRLGTATQRRGTVRFNPSGGARQRTIVASVTQNGLPRDTLTVTRYQVARGPKPKLRSLKAKRSRNTLRITSRRARGQWTLVEVRAGKAILHRVLTRGSLSVSVPTAGKLTVTARPVGTDGTAGRPRRVTVR
jgi:hypothetical protein